MTVLVRAMPARRSEGARPDDHVLVLSLATSKQLEAHARLVHDAVLGDRTLFTRADGIERLWEVSARAPGEVHEHEPGSWGPAAAGELLRPRRWHVPDEAAA